MCNTTSTNPIVDNLIASPMFNLSLSSKELFHSNFLAWLGNNPVTKDFFTAVINDLVSGLNLSLTGTWTVEREDQHFDLCIKDKNKNKDQYLLIIENKVKSIPIKKQLDLYVQKKVNGKNLNTKYLLLTLTERFAYRETKIEKSQKYPSNHWIVKTYKDFAVVMRNKLSMVSNDTYLRSILYDYIGFIENLDLLVRAWQDEKEFAKDWDDISKLKDIHAKIQFSRYCEKLKKEYFEKRKEDKCPIFSNIIVYDDDSIPDPKNVDRTKIYVKVYWGYASRGQEGILDIEIPVTCLDKPQIVTGLKTGKNGKVITSPYSIKIQVQGHFYRHVIETNTDIADSPVDDDLINIGRNTPYTEKPVSGLDYFSPNPLLDNQLTNPNYGNCSIFDANPRSLYPVNKGDAKNQIPDKRWPFASYKDQKGRVQFIYQYRKIKKNASIEKVLENITAEVERIVKFLLNRTSP